MLSLQRLAGAAALLLTTSLAAGQAAYSEGFDGLTQADLVSQGWAFRNQSDIPGQLGWRTANVTTPQAGTHYLVSDGYCCQPPGVGSNWALLPAVSGQSAGDVMSFFLAEGWSALRSDILEVRYSPSGGTSTGSSAQDVGDFTLLLDEYPFGTLGSWGEHTIVLPGSGRLAFRFYVPTGYAAGMYVDSLAIGDPPSGPVPLPESGEVVSWTLGMSPILLPVGVTNIPAGGTVVVEPGVRVELPASSSLKIFGSMRFDRGTELHAPIGSSIEVPGGQLSLLGKGLERILVTGDSSSNNPGLLVHAGGLLNMRGVDADIFVRSASAATVVAQDCILDSNSSGQGQASGFGTFNGTLALRDIRLFDGAIIENGGYLLLDRCTFVNTRVQLLRTTSPQVLYLNRLNITGVEDAAPLEIHRFDAFFGPLNRIARNLYPVRLEGGGIAPGSVLPVAGNTFNHISGVARFGSRSTWANAGLPYVLDQHTGIVPLSGQLTIEPGVTARFLRDSGSTSNAFPVFALAKLIARGTPFRPILLTDASGAGWGGLYFNDNSGKRPKLEHVHVEQADVAVTGAACNVRLIDCELRDSFVGASSNSAGRITARGSQFLRNGRGVQTSPGANGGSTISAGRADLRALSNPNSFVDNTEGVVVQNPNIPVDASGAWWGDSSGPQHTSNAGGLGDSATPTVNTTPFLTSAPQLDYAPRVRLQRVGDIQEEGNRLILRWSVEDEGTITAQRVEFSPHGENPALTTLVPDIAGDARTIEIEVPANVPSSNLQLPVLRVVAVDNAGQEGYDEVQFFTPYDDEPGPFAIAPLPATVRPGEQHDVCWSIASGDAYLILDDIDYSISLGGTTTTCLPLGLRVPGVSTDTARIAVVNTYGASGRAHYEYSDTFSIRPSARIGDAPPRVNLTSPLQPSFLGGTTVPISWSASDDEGLRSFLIQASFDGGRSWNSLVEQLPSTTRDWNWDLPESQGIDGVQLRVIATDLRFQTSSDARAFDLSPSL